MSDLVSRLRMGFGSACGRREQVGAYYDISSEAAERIEALEEGLINIKHIAENNKTGCGTCHTVLEFMAIHHRDIEEPTK